MQLIIFEIFVLLLILLIIIANLLRFFKSQLIAYTITVFFDALIKKANIKLSNYSLITKNLIITKRLMC